MAERYDAVIIGAGIIGAATGYELAKRGQKTLNIDMLPAAGYGSTSNSCAIIRVHYSTWDGIALAYEGYFYWRDWADYLGVADERGLADFVECGCLVMKTEHNGFLAKHRELADELGIPYQPWGPAEVGENLPVYQLKSFWPAEAFGGRGLRPVQRRRRGRRALLSHSRLHLRPAARHPQHSAGSGSKGWRIPLW